MHSLKLPYLLNENKTLTFRLKAHVEDPTKLPILIFPEGTCINNTSVMQFKKGSFEVGGTIFPVAIKYDPKFGDAFWDSSKYGERISLIVPPFHTFIALFARYARLHLHDDDLVGHRLRRLVLASHGATGKRKLGRLCQQGERGNRQKGWPRRPRVVITSSLQSTYSDETPLRFICRDGNLKRQQVKSEWKAKQQEEFSRRFKTD